MRRLLLSSFLILVLGASMLPTAQAQTEQFYAERLEDAEWGPTTVGTRTTVHTTSITSDGNDIVAIVWRSEGITSPNAYGSAGRINATITGPVISNSYWYGPDGGETIACFRYQGIVQFACDAAPLAATIHTVSTTQSSRKSATLSFEIETPGWPSGLTTTGSVTAVYVIRFGVPPLRAIFEATPTSGPAPLTVQFTDTSLGDVISWDWNFGDGTGQTASEGGDTQHTFIEKGIYFVTLTVTDGEQTDTFSRQIDVGTEDDLPSACLNLDQQFRQPARWATTGQVEFREQGVIVYPGARLTAAASLFLDAANSYNITVFAKSLTTYAGAFKVNLGESSFNFTVAPGAGPAIFQAPADNPDPDEGLFYSLGVINTGMSPLLFTSLCVDDGTRSLKPGRCLFINPSFDGTPATVSWQTTGTVTDGEAPGYIKLADGAAISQNVKLYPTDPEHPHQYLLYAHVTVGPAARSAYENNLVDTISLEYKFPQTGDFEPIQSPAGTDQPLVGTLFTQSGYNASFLPNGYTVFRTYITVSDVTDDVFTFRANSSNPDILVYVTELCIDDTFAHHEDYPWLPIWDLDPQCSYIAIPTTNDFGAWTYWHWQNLEQFFRCDLMKLLNRMFNTMWAGYKLLQWQIVYWQSLIMQTNQWFSTDLFPWLDGHFRNIAVGQITNIEGGSGAGFWDVLLAIVNLIWPIVSLITSTLGAAATLLLSVITGVIAFVVSLASQALAILQQATGLLGTLISAYNNAPPETLPGMPSCTANPKGHPLCIAWWVLDNTIFSGPGALVIPVITGVLSIHLVLWVVGELKRSLIETGSSS